MKKKQTVITWVVLAFLAIASSGCAVIGAAVSAGISYAIYEATK